MFHRRHPRWKISPSLSIRAAMVAPCALSGRIPAPALLLQKRSDQNARGVRLGSAGIVPISAVLQFLKRERISVRQSHLLCAQRSVPRLRNPDLRRNSRQVGLHVFAQPNSGKMIGIAIFEEVGGSPCPSTTISATIATRNLNWCSPCTSTTPRSNARTAAARTWSRRQKRSSRSLQRKASNRSIAETEMQHPAETTTEFSP